MSEKVGTNIEYLQFFGFKYPPFPLLVDPRIFFSSKTHEETLEVLRFGIERGDPFLILCGPPGVGKTHLLRILLQLLSEKFEANLVFCPPLGPDEFFLLLSDHLGLVEGTLAKEKLFSALEDKLQKLSLEGRKLLIILDEAQNLVEDSLEIVRLFFNLRNIQKLQILLSGTNELKLRLSEEKFQALAQRISIVQELHPLTQKESQEYILFRIQKAEGQVQIEKKAWDVIYNFSKGIPREINRIMDRALFLAYAEQSKILDRNILEEAVKTFAKDPVKKPRKIWTLFARKSKIEEHRIVLIEEQISHYRRRLEELVVEVERYKEAIFRLEELKTSLENRIAEEITPLKETISEIYGKINFLLEENKVNKSCQEKIRSIEEKMVDQFQEIINQFQQEILMAQNELREEMHRILEENLLHKKENLENLEEKFQRLEEEIALLKSQIIEEIEKKQELEDKLSNMEKTLEELKKEKSRLRKSNFSREEGHLLRWGTVLERL